MSRGCSRPGCGGAHSSRGLCRRHYQQAMRAGTPPPTVYQPHLPGQTCKVPRCEGLIHGGGYCRSHYDLLAAPRCEAWWCGRKRSYADGLCVRCHYWVLRATEAVRAGEPLPRKPRWTVTPTRPVVEAAPVLVPSSAGQLCPRGCGRERHQRAAIEFPPFGFKSCPGVSAGVAA